MSNVTRFGVDPTLARELATKNYVDIQEGGLTFARKVKASETQTVVSSTTLVNDDTLFVALNPSKKYHFLLIMAWFSKQLPDLKITFVAPTGSVGFWGEAGKNVTALALAVTKILIGQNFDNIVSSIHGSVTTDTTAGNLIFQWAQNTSNSEPTLILNGSTLLVWEEP